MNAEHTEPSDTRPNVFNYINLSSSDNSGMLRWLTDELQDAEDKEERGEAEALCPIHRKI